MTLRDELRELQEKAIVKKLRENEKKMTNTCREAAGEGENEVILAVSGVGITNLEIERFAKKHDLVLKVMSKDEDGSYNVVKLSW